MSIPRATSTTSRASARAFASTTLLMLALSIMLGLGGCTKESLKEEAKAPASPLIGDPYMPEPDDIMPLIRAANERKLAYAQGVRDCSEEEPLQEAIWLAEALMNYEKGDASRYGEDWITDSVEYSFPVSVRSDGSVWIRECDFFTSYQDAMAQVELAASGHRVYMLDHSFVSIEDGFANILIEWTDRDPDSGIAGPYEPSYTGCHDVDFAAALLTSHLRWAFHSVAPEVGSFYVTLDQNWYEVSTNQSTIPNNYGIGCYYGTSISAGGAALLYNGNDFDNCVCFPEAWERLQLARTINFDQVGIQPGRVVTKEHVIHWGYDVGGIPIGCYPVGFWNHSYRYKTGHLVYLPTP